MQSKKTKITLSLLALVLFLVLFAMFSSPKDKNYSVSFDTDGGTLIETIIVKKGEKIQLPEAPAKEGFIFKGWF